MSLEAQLERLNENLEKLIPALLAGTGASETVVADPTKKQETPAPAAEKPSSDTKEEPAASTAEPEVDYKQVSAAVLRLMSKIGKDDTAAFLSSDLKVASARDLKPEQYRDALAKVNAKLAEMEA